jgi:predicted AlkP superfamily pyrophosphatase or phosphodiesterase
MRKLFFVLLLFPLSILAQTDTTQKVVPNRTNSVRQMQKPYVIMISVDGLRYDLVDKAGATNLKQLRNRGVSAKSMTPSYPSLTFPNHYSLVTGLYPAHHGLVDNTFYDQQKNATYKISNRQVVTDSSWYGGTPLWVLAENQQMVSASFYWVGSEAAIQGVRPTYYYYYNEAISPDARVQDVKNWLTLPEEKRPHLITFYFPDVDHEEHMHGPESAEAYDAVRRVDSTIGKMVAMTDALKLPVNYIVVSDHGMIAVDTLNTLKLPVAIDTTKFYVPDSDVILHLYAKDKKDVRPTYEALKKEAVDYSVYLPDQTPARWHYATGDDRYNRIGDILLVPKPPKVFNIRGRRMAPGKHGFDNSLPEMQATFYAWGPAFKQNIKINPFNNVHVYPLVARILGLTISEKIDGSVTELQQILK